MLARHCWPRVLTLLPEVGFFRQDEEDGNIGSIGKGGCSIVPEVGFLDRMNKMDKIGSAALYD